MTQICIRCKLDQPIDFYRIRKDTGKLSGYCKICSGELTKISKDKLAENGTKRYCRTCKNWLELEKFQKRNDMMDNHCKNCVVDLVKLGSFKKSVIIDNKKLCMQCLDLLDISNFNYLAKGVGKLNGYCEPCRKTYHRNKYDPEKSKEQSYRWRKENREVYLAQHRIHQFNRKALIKATDDGTVTKEFLIEIYAKENCRYCKKFVEIPDRTLEHIVALSEGGLHSASNIDMACFDCNSKKRHEDEDTWRQKNGY